MNRVILFVGEFGSGKTEVAMNYAFHLKAAGHLTAIIDMDIIKPYFRTRENSEILKEKGIKVVAPDNRLAHSDLPVLPAELSRILNDNLYHVVMDIGGGESAIVLGQFRQKIKELNPAILMVVNTRRPFTSTREGIIGTLERIQQVSGLKITGFVCNTNIGKDTSVQHILEGYTILSDIAEELELPIQFTVIPEWLSGGVRLDNPLFILHPYTQYPWMEHF